MHHPLRHLSFILDEGPASTSNKLTLLPLMTILEDQQLTQVIEHLFIG